MALDTATTAQPLVLEPSERDAVLAGLRLLQLHQDRLLIVVAGEDDRMELIDDIAGENGEPLSNDRIDALCERINS